MVTSCPPSSIARDEPAAPRDEPVGERGALVAAGLQRLHARARSGGQRRLRAGEKRGGRSGCTTTMSMARETGMACI